MKLIVATIFKFSSILHHYHRKTFKLYSFYTWTALYVGLGLGLGLRVRVYVKRRWQWSCFSWQSCFTWWWVVRTMLMYVLFTSWWCPIAQLILMPSIIYLPHLVTIWVFTFKVLKKNSLEVFHTKNLLFLLITGQIANWWESQVQYQLSPSTMIKPYHKPSHTRANQWL